MSLKSCIWSLDRQFEHVWHLESEGLFFLRLWILGYYCCLFCLFIFCEILNGETPYKLCINNSWESRLQVIKLLDWLSKPYFVFVQFLLSSSSSRTRQTLLYRLLNCLFDRLRIVNDRNSIASLKRRFITIRVFDTVRIWIHRKSFERN